MPFLVEKRLGLNNRRKWKFEAEQKRQLKVGNNIVFNKKISGLHNFEFLIP